MCACSFPCFFISGVPDTCNEASYLPDSEGHWDLHTPDTFFWECPSSQTDLCS